MVEWNHTGLITQRRRSSRTPATEAAGVPQRAPSGENSGNWDPDGGRCGKPYRPPMRMKRSVPRQRWMGTGHGCCAVSVATRELPDMESDLPVPQAGV